MRKRIPIITISVRLVEMLLMWQRDVWQCRQKYFYLIKKTGIYPFNLK
ncbi:MAG TPA: hypothetical protein DHV15_04340 [Treponema sp.]|uniref:Uncharacterized protein n=1 Tax=Treponema denticola (strain ATCC 35405 / DSM 14222 / CIP 103919 / JCM 8153 / KCTC 15104) TaxID=243275 RepID=Q73KP7_TREDE|nr:hypothetical protein TDE_2170 [Treponema denticola ATCC 35405]HCY94728.1 hypothetical protein [Treponema sp.]